MREIVVDVQHVSKSFGSEQVLEDVTLQLMRGKIHGIIGRNGSGKTVLMKCICGFLRPKEAEKSQRLDTRHTGQRQKFFCKTRNHKTFPLCFPKL